MIRLCETGPSLLPKRPPHPRLPLQHREHSSSALQSLRLELRALMRMKRPSQLAAAYMECGRWRTCLDRVRPQTMVLHGRRRPLGLHDRLPPSCRRDTSPRYQRLSSLALHAHLETIWPRQQHPVQPARLLRKLLYRHGPHRHPHEPTLAPLPTKPDRPSSE